jgi:hypothetical protein
MARTSRARTTARAPWCALNRLLSADGVRRFFGIPVATWGAVGVSVATRPAARQCGAKSGILVSLGAELTSPVRPGLLPS